MAQGVLGIRARLRTIAGPPPSGPQVLLPRNPSPERSGSPTWPFGARASCQDPTHSAGRPASRLPGPAPGQAPGSSAPASAPRSEELPLRPRLRSGPGFPGGEGRAGLTSQAGWHAEEGGSPSRLEGAAEPIGAQDTPPGGHMKTCPHGQFPHLTSQVTLETRVRRPVGAALRLRLVSERAPWAPAVSSPPGARPTPRLRAEGHLSRGLVCGPRTEGRGTCCPRCLPPTAPPSLLDAPGGPSPPAPAPGDASLTARSAQPPPPAPTSSQHLPPGHFHT